MLPYHEYVVTTTCLAGFFLARKCSMIPIPAHSTLASTAGGLLTASTASIVPLGEMALPLFLGCGLVIGFIWPHAPWRPPLALALATALSMPLIAAIVALFSTARPAAFVLVLPGQSGLVSGGESLIASALILAIAAIITTSLGAWSKDVITQAITPDTARRVHARAQSLPPVTPDGLPAVAASVATPEDGEPPREVAAR